MSRESIPPSDSMTVIDRYKHLSTKQVMDYVGVTTAASVWNYVKEGKLPKPRYLSPHKPIWQLGEVVDHIHKKIQSYDDHPRGYRGQELQKNEAPNKTRVTKLKERLGLK